MKNIKLLIITLLFSSLLIGCGMKGPLYYPPVVQPTPPAMAKADQDNATTATAELTNGDENTTATDKQQTAAEQEKPTKTTASE